MPRDRYDRAFRDRHRRGHPVQQEWAGRGEYGAAYEAPYVPYEEPYRVSERMPERVPERVPERTRPGRGRYSPEERGRRIRFHGYGMGYGGGARRSRGSYGAGQLRSGLNPRDEFEFRWGDGYVGGRGYGGTNYDYAHGYRTSGGRRRPRGRARPPESAEAAQGPGVQGPARYGYGPYHERLTRQRRSDDDIRADVEESLFYDTWVDVDRIDVKVDDGIVTLAGTLPDHSEVRYATDDAWDVDGVRGVHTELDVKAESTTEQLDRRREYGAGDVAEANVARGGERSGEEPVRGRTGARDGGAARPSARSSGRAAAAESEPRGKEPGER